jgi:hypothetical protein
LFVNGEGQYGAFLAGRSGDLQNMRDVDGVHLSLSGADRLAGAVLQRLMAEAQGPENTTPGFAGP